MVANPIPVITPNFEKHVSGSVIQSKLHLTTYIPLTMKCLDSISLPYLAISFKQGNIVSWIKETILFFM